MASISKTTTSKSEVRYRVYWRDPAGHLRERWFVRKVDAERFGHEVETDMSRGEYLDPRAGKVTLGEFMARHEAARVGRRLSTIARDESYINTHILPTFGHRQLKSIHAVEVRAWVADLIGKGKAPATVRKAHQLLASALEAACDDGLIARNPARNVGLPKIDRREMRFLDRDQVYALAEAIDPRYRCLVLTAAFTGLRFGELAALKMNRLDMLRRTLRVEETLTEVRGHLAFGPPKTAAARRTVSLPKTLVEELAAHLAAFPVGREGLLFSAPLGGPLRVHLFRRRAWTPAVRASVGEPCRFHDLRHTHAALLIAQKAHPKVIQARLGHASISTTLDTYGHLFEGLDAAAAEALDDSLRGRAVGLALG